MPSHPRAWCLTSLLLAVSAASSTHAAECDAAKYLNLALTSNFTACMTASDVPLLTLEQAPTDAQLRAICETSECVTLLGLVLGANLEECTLPVGAHIQLKSQLLEPALAVCETLGVEVTITAPQSAGSGSSSTEPNGELNSSLNTEVDGSSAEASSTNGSADQHRVAVMTGIMGLMLAVAPHIVL